MPSEEDKYIPLEFAPTEYKRDLKFFKYRISKGDLFAYARIPSYLTSPPPYPGEPEFDWAWERLDQFWEGPLSSICRIEPEIEWVDGEVRTSTIKVTDATGAAPTPAVELCGPSGRYRISPNGSFYWHYGWRFKEDKILINLEELEKLTTNTGTPYKGTQGVSPGYDADGQIAQNNHELNIREASKILMAQRTLERDKFVELIMARIHEGIKDVSVKRGTNRVINHIRFIREANVPPEKFITVKDKVVEQITKTYRDVGFKPLSRAPKKKMEEDYFLPL